MTTRKKLLWILVSLLIITLVVIELFWRKTYYRNPLHFSSYSQTGYYEIYPESILYSLDNGETNIFKSASEEIWNRDKTFHEVIQWSQSDYLKIADMLSQEVWHEPLDLKEWNILSLWLDQSCMDAPQGFHTFKIVYFQKSEFKFWNRQYHVRYIEIIPWQSLIRWGDSNFSDVLLPGWGNASLNDFKITADGALLIAENNGGSKIRQEVKNRCRISVYLINYPPVTGFTDNNWRVDYDWGNFYIYINPYSGKFESD